MSMPEALLHSVCALEFSTVDFENGLKALDTAVADLVENNDQVDFSALLFVEKGLRCVHDELLANLTEVRKAHAASRLPENVGEGGS